MAQTIRGDLNLIRALFIDGDEGSAGELFTSEGGNKNSWSSIQDLVSTDSGNDLGVGSDGKFKLVETVTVLSYNSSTHSLSFTNEQGATNSIDLAALTTDIYATGLSLSGGVLTLSDNDGDTTNVTVDLNALQSILTDNSDGTYTHNNGTDTIVTIDTRDGISSDSGNQLTLGADGRPKFIETNTGLSIAGASLVYDRESGANQTVNLIASDANNRIAVGDAGTGLHVPQIRSVSPFNATTDWGSVSGGFYTITKSAATFSNASANAIFQVQEGASTPFETSVALHSAKLNADGSVTLKVPSSPNARFAGRVVYVG